MNSIMSEYWPIFTMYQDLRNQMMTLLTDGDLAFTPGSTNLTLGALCREMGEVEHACCRHASSWEFIRKRC
jgi:hypothetical protein